MDRREAWLLREAARKQANAMGLHEWAEEIAQETVLRCQHIPLCFAGFFFYEAVLFIVEAEEAIPEPVSVHLH